MAGIPPARFLNYRASSVKFPGARAVIVDMGTVKIQMCYEIVTPESAEHGDMADHGFAEPGGWTYSIVDEEFEERRKAVGHGQAVKDVIPAPEEFDSADEAIEFLSNYGPFEPSCYPVCDNGHCWLTQADGDENYSTGEVKRLSFHFKGVNPRVHGEILAAVL